MKTKFILFLAVFCLSVALFLYFIVFHSGLSDCHEEWGSFGSYIGGIGGIILSCSLFYYTYTIDKDHRKIEKNAKILKLIDVVGESFVCIQRLKDINYFFANENIFDRGISFHEQMENEKNNLVIKLWTNYKTTQVLASHLYKMDLPNVAALHETEAHFYKVYEKISPTSDK